MSVGMEGMRWVDVASEVRDGSNGNPERRYGAVRSRDTSARSE
jgi:hypothetical protein